MKAIPKRANITELEQLCNLSTNPIKKHIRKAHIPKGKDGKYNVGRVLNAILKHRNQYSQTAAANGKRETAGASEFKFLKVDLECQILQVKLDQLKGQLIPLDEHFQEIREYAGMVNGVFEKWISEVSALTRNKHLVDEAERLADMARRQLVRALEGK